MAVRIADVLGVSVEYLVKGTENNKMLSPQIAHLVSSIKELSGFDIETLQILVDRMRSRLQN